MTKEDIYPCGTSPPKSQVILASTRWKGKIIYAVAWKRSFSMTRGGGGWTTKTADYNAPLSAQKGARLFESRTAALAFAREIIPSMPHPVAFATGKKPSVKYVC